jgi:beta-glucanase (GH16 family)
MRPIQHRRSTLRRRALGLPATLLILAVMPALLGATIAAAARTRPPRGHATTRTAHRHHHRRRHHRRHHRRRAGAHTTTPPVPPAPIWSDEFSGPAGAAPNPAKWTAQTGGGWGGNELECYTGRASNVSLDGAGHLAITAQRETCTDANGRTCRYTSARLQTNGLFQTTYGELEARLKLPAGQGLWPAFWALGSDIDSVGWPASGEIDVMESIGNNPFSVYGSIHGPVSGSMTPYGITVAHTSPVSLADGFHTYGVTWSPSSIVFTLDGVPYASDSPAALAAGRQWVFGKPFFLLLDLAVGGTWPGSPDATTPFPATLLVDWVRVYS